MADDIHSIHDEVNSSLLRAKETLNLSEYQFQGVVLAAEHMKNKKEANQSQTE
jgi:hypothetical protein